MRFLQIFFIYDNFGIYFFILFFLMDFLVIFLIQYETPGFPDIVLPSVTLRPPPWILKRVDWKALVKD